jgi:hypothetical protein
VADQIAAAAGTDRDGAIRIAATGWGGLALENFFTEPEHLAQIDLSAVRDSSHDHQTVGVVHRVDDPVIADAHAEVVSTGQLRRSRRAWVDRKGVDGHPDPFFDGPLKLSVLASRNREEAYLVAAVGYSRTSAQGTASSRSTRACSAARLSSR